MASRIPFLDFGGEGPLLHFAHANGYPPACYKQMMAPLVNDYRVIAIEQRPLWPASDPDQLSGWMAFVDDLIAFFEQEGLQDAIGVGHSLGAVVTMYAALRRPELFRKLVLIEPVFLIPAILQQIAGKAGPLDEQDMALIKIANSRRNEWASRQEAFDHFRAKRVFARWPDEALWDYIYHGLQAGEDGQFRLAYSPEWEARVYSLPPTDIWETIPQVKHPTLAIRGAATDTLVPAAWQLWQMAQPSATFVEIPDAGHLLTMEKPQRAAEMIAGFLREK